jgi:hypothetical protein
MAGKSSQLPFSQSDLGRWKLLADFQSRLAEAAQPERFYPSLEDGRRKLQAAQYLSLFLFGLLNPVVRTMRALCSASHLPRLQEEVCRRPVSLGSFSEAQHVLNPALLQRVFADLSQELSCRQPPASGPASVRPWLIQDSTLWEALPRMGWALWRTQRTTQRAVRLHVSLHVLEDKPVRAQVTAGAQCEREVWKETWQKGDAFVGDRNFGGDYRLFEQLEQKGCAFVLRLREDASVEVQQELSVSPQDRQAGVLRQAWAVLGCEARRRSRRVRVVWLQGPKEVLLLVTNQTPEELSGATVSQLYRSRWQVELFFRWIKCILGCRHWLAQSPEGVALQIYLALIAALLLQLYTGRRPTRRMMELIQFYLLGVASLADLEAGLEREKARLARQKSK